MRKILILPVILSMSFNAFAAESDGDINNIFFGDKQNQISASVGSSFGSMSPELDSGFLMLQYSQPTQIFRLDGRWNLNASMVANPDNVWFMGGVSFDVALLSWRDLYFGAGIGAYIRTDRTERLDSRFTFGERAFIGYKLTDTVNIEFFVHHFSNGDITDKNLGYNFFGVSASWNF